MKYLLILFLPQLIYFNNPKGIKKISDENYRYEFYTTQELINSKLEKNYYWFKGGGIHKSQGNFSGELLNDMFTKYYHSNQLAEKGNFNNGLKSGKWITWFESGKIETIEYWNNGLLKGDYFKYNSSGELILSGKYKKGKKNGKWIDHVKKDTLNYKNNIIIVPKVKLSIEDKKKLKAEKKLKKATKKESFFSKIFKKKNNETEITKNKKTNNQPKEDSFFKRIFKKKSTELKKENKKVEQELKKNG